MLVLFFPKLPNQEPKGLPNRIILNIWALLSFISVDILQAKTAPTWVVCLAVRFFFLFVFNIVPVLFFAAAFYLFNHLFVNLTLASWQFAIFYNTVTLLWEYLNLVTLISSKIVKTNVDSSSSSSSSSSSLSSLLPLRFFNCPTNSIF